MRRVSASSLAMAFLTGISSPSLAAPIPANFDSRDEDRMAIEKLLSDATKAHFSRDQGLFESWLLGKDISFSEACPAIKSVGTEHPAPNCERFRQGVFEGAPFEQRFQDLSIRRDGPSPGSGLRSVNTAGGQSSWGWNTLQLLKLDGRWNIASEAYTGHAG